MGISYMLPVINKTITAVKAEPGNYENWGWYNWIQTNSGNARPNISASSFRWNAGETTDVTIKMVFQN